MEKLNFNKIIYIICGALIIYSILSTLKCNENKQGKESVLKGIDTLRNNYETIIGKRDERITTQYATIMERDEAIALGLIRENNLKKVKSQVRIVTETKLDTLFIPFEKSDSIFILREKGMSFRNFNVVNQWYEMQGYSDSLGIMFNRISFVNKFQITIGSKRQGLSGWFKKDVSVVEVVNENPHTSITGMENIIIRNEKKWYERRIWGILLSGSVGCYIGWKTRGKIQENINQNN